MKRMCLAWLLVISLYVTKFLNPVNFRLQIRFRSRWSRKILEKKIGSQESNGNFGSLSVLTVTSDCSPSNYRCQAEQVDPFSDVKHEFPRSKESETDTSRYFRSCVRVLRKQTTGSKRLRSVSILHQAFSVIRKHSRYNGSVKTSPYTVRLGSLVGCHGCTWWKIGDREVPCAWLCGPV